MKKFFYKFEVRINSYISYFNLFYVDAQISFSLNIIFKENIYKQGMFTKIILNIKQIE